MVAVFDTVLVDSEDHICSKCRSIIKAGDEHHKFYSGLGSTGYIHTVRAHKDCFPELKTEVEAIPEPMIHHSGY